MVSLEWNRNVLNHIKWSDPQSSCSSITCHLCCEAQELIQKVVAGSMGVREGSVLQDVGNDSNKQVVVWHDSTGGSRRNFKGIPTNLKVVHSSTFQRWDCGSKSFNVFYVFNVFYTGVMNVHNSGRISSRTCEILLCVLFHLHFLESFYPQMVDNHFGIKGVSCSYLECFHTFKNFLNIFICWFTFE